MQRSPPFDYEISIITPMGLTRSQIIRGPAKIIFGGITYWTPDDITLEIDPGLEDVKSSLFGVLDALVVNPKVTVNFTPHMFTHTGTGAEIPGIATVLAALVPAIFTNGYYGTAYIGAGSEAEFVIWAASGEQITISNAVITKPPSITFAADKPLFGSCTVTGICKTTSSDIILGAANSIFNEATGASDPGLAALGVPTYLQRRYKAVLGSQTGFTEMWGENGWTVDFNPSWTERKIQGLTVDFELSGMEIMVKGVPTGPTMDQVIKLVGVGGDNGASWAQGQRLTTQQATHSLTIVEPGGPTTMFTLNKPLIRQAGFRFGYETLRVGELGFHSMTRLSAGAAVALGSF